MANFPQLQALLKRDPRAHKYDFGHVLVIGGSKGMVGAPYMAGMSALRAGAGLVTIASFPEVINQLESRTLEIMTSELPLETQAAVTYLMSLTAQRRISVVVMGPGVNTLLARVCCTLLPQLTVPVVIDAGVLTALGDDISVLAQAAEANHGLILTPHWGEYAKLRKVDISDEERAEAEAAKFVQHYQVTLVLKGHQTLVATKYGNLYRNNSGNAGMATAGTGDVLAGVIAGLLAQGMSPQLASEWGVYLHGLAGDLAANKKTQPGMIATDLIESLPEAWARIGTD